MSLSKSVFLLETHLSTTTGSPLRNRANLPQPCSRLFALDLRQVWRPCHRGGSGHTEAPSQMNLCPQKSKAIPPGVGKNWHSAFWKPSVEDS